jgi:hypothetical protein
VTDTTGLRVAVATSALCGHGREYRQSGMQV